MLINYNGNTYTSFTAFFDPRQNQYFGNNGKISVRSFQMAITELTKRENYAQLYLALNRNLNTYDGVSSYSLSIKHLIDQIPDQYMFMLYFTHIHGYDEGILKVYLKFAEPNTDYFLASINNHDIGTLKLQTSREFFLRLGSSAEVSDFLSKFKAAAEKWLSFFNDCGHYSTVPGGRNYFDSFFKGMFQYYLGNQQAFSSTDGENTYAPGDLVSSSQLGVCLTTTDSGILTGHSFSLSYNNPPQVDNRNHLYRLHNYSANVCKFISWPKTLKDEKKPVLYGVELECSYSQEIRDIIDAQQELFFFVKSDGSVTGNKRNRGEFVTVPMSLKAHKKHWAQWFSKVSYDTFDITKDTNNGMHVHIDRKAFMNDTHLKNMVWFYAQPCNKDFLAFISERDGQTEYAKPIRIPSDYTKVNAYKNIYSIASRERTQLLNLTKGPTVEVRLFKGIVSFAELLKNLEFTDAVFHFCEGEKSVNKLSFVDFIQWLNTEVPRNRYTTLRKFLDQCKNLDKMLLRAEIANITFNKTKDEDIVATLNKSNVRITNEHISALNKGRSRTFILDSATGKVKLFVKPGSRLASLDRVLEKRYTFTAAV